MNYNDSEDYKHLEKLSDLEKRFESGVIAGKTRNGVFRQNVLKPLQGIPHVVRMRFIKRVPIEDLNESIDSGTDDFASHVQARGIILKPQEAMYHAIGIKDKAIYDLLNGITLTDVISMIRNKAAVRQYECPRPMNIADNDVPRYINRMMILRSSLPQVLSKVAKDADIRKSYQITVDSGEQYTIGEKNLFKNREKIQNFIDDGKIIKIIRLYSNGNKTGNLIKEASPMVKEALYLSMLYHH